MVGFVDKFYGYYSEDEFGLSSGFICYMEFVLGGRVYLVIRVESLVVLKVGLIDRVLCL